MSAEHAIPATNVSIFEMSKFLKKSSIPKYPKFTKNC